jgi:hypothetical protein
MAGFNEIYVIGRVTIRKNHVIFPVVMLYSKALDLVKVLTCQLDVCGWHNVTPVDG